MTDEIQPIQPAPIFPPAPPLMDPAPVHPAPSPVSLPLVPFPKEPKEKAPPPIFSTEARSVAGKLTRANGKAVAAADRAPWVYTLITIDGTVAGAIMADAAAHFLEVGPYTFRTSHVTTPRNGSVPVIFLSSGQAAEIRDPKVIPPDVFGGMTNLAGIAALNAWAAYHDPVPFRGPDGKEVKAVVAKDAKVVVAEPDAPISRDAVAA